MMKKIKKRIFLSSISILPISIPLITISASTKVSLKKDVEIIGIKAFGTNGQGYVNFNSYRLESKGITNFSYKVLDEYNLEVDNFNIKNGDKIKYKFKYQSNWYESTHIVKSLSNSPKKLFDHYANEILKAINNGESTVSGFLKISRLRYMNSGYDSLFRITVLSDQNWLNVKANDSFYITISKFYNEIEKAEIVKSKSIALEGVAKPSYWNYNDQGSFLTKLRLNFNTPKNTLFKLNLTK